MKRSITLLALPLALGLSACASDGYYGEYGTSVGWGSPYAYNGWYDGYYGPIYDGYWGRDGFFYYRSAPGARAFVRGDRNHFRRDAPPPGGRYQEFRGNFQPRRDYHMPNYPHGGGPRGGGRPRGHGH